MFVVHLPKNTVGEHFNNLGMLTTLLASKREVEVKNIGAQPLIEVIQEDSTPPDHTPSDYTPLSGDDGDGDIFEVKEKNFNWTERGSLCISEEADLKGLNQASHSYGFTGQHTAVFTKLKDEIPSMVDVPDPDSMSLQERRSAREDGERTDFDPNHYLADLFEDVEIRNILKFDPPWSQLMQSKKECPSDSEGGEHDCHGSKSVVPQDNLLTESDRLFMKDLPNKEYLIDHETERSLYLGLVDLVFAFAYNYRINEGDNSVESAWNVCKLSSTLSWFDVFTMDAVNDVLLSSVCRSLCYPLYRNWELAMKVINDVICIFRLGKHQVLHCLISMHKAFTSTEPYYILNNLYITDYTVWVQTAKEGVFESLANEIEKVNIEKSNVGFDLPELEEAAQLVIAEEKQELTVTQN